MLSTHHKDDFASYGGSFYWFHGVVEDVADPMQLGRVRVRCVGYHTDDISALPVSSLPWALCLLPITSPSMAGIGQSATGIQQGSWVIGFFRDGPSAQDPIILGTIASTTVEKADTTAGFSDPSGQNPAKTGPDIPSETTGSGTLIAKTSASFFTLGTHVISPAPSAYIKPQYPYNQVIKTRSGHVIEYDDTPGKERLSFMHKTGAFIEIDPDGNINICGKNVNIKGNAITLN